MTPAMKMNKAAANTFEHTENKQQGLIYTEFLNNNKFNTDQPIRWHLNSATSVIVGLMIIFALCFIWQVCKKKNMKNKCLKQCRVTEETFEEQELSMSFTTRGSPRAETIPVYSAD